MIEPIEQPLLVIPNTSRTGYERIWQLKKQLHRNIPDLLALAPGNDPFFAGSALDYAMGRWFAAMWTRLGFVQGVHLRRIHYRILDLADRQKHDGTPYENTEADWGYLNECSKLARVLRLVPAEAFIDRRNPAAHLPGWVQWGLEPPMPPTCTLPSATEWSPWTLPAIESDLSSYLDQFVLPSPTVDGYQSSSVADRRYYLEVWVEKSTQDDILTPLCQALGIGYVTSIGFQSMTRAIELLHRVKRIGKPTRILYISDFDPAGDGMPVAVARHLEFWLPIYAPGADIKLLPFVLTRAQVEHYRLPRIPVKDTDRRKANFEERYGEGAVELDALEARAPGTLARLVREAVAPYHDEMLEDRLADAEEEAERLVRHAWHARMAPYEEELREIHTEAQAILRQYETRLEELDYELQAQLDPLKERLQEIRDDVTGEIESFTAELPERPEPDIEPPDERHWLFDSQRDYLDQMSVYKARKSHQRTSRQ